MTATQLDIVITGLMAIIIVGGLIDSYFYGRSRT